MIIARDDGYENPVEGKTYISPLLKTHIAMKKQSE